MSGILHRTAFYDQTGGFVRPADWAIVQTSLGAMVEPFQLGLRHAPDVPEPTGGFDWTDMMCRVDVLRRMDVHKFNAEILNFGSPGPQFHGGYQIPRDGL